LKTLLRVAAALSFAWAFVLFFDPPQLAGRAADLGGARALGRGLAIAQLGFAYLFWRASGDPAAERGTIYAGLMILALRAANGTYEVLYLLQGRPALASLFDMVTSLGLFVGILNTLPGIVHPSDGGAPSDRSTAPPGG
jgi:hypothetical protein